MAEEALRDSMIEIPDEFCTVTTETDLRQNQNRQSQQEHPSMNSADYDTQFFNEFIPTVLEEGDYKPGVFSTGEA